MDAYLCVFIYRMATGVLVAQTACSHHTFLVGKKNTFLSSTQLIDSLWEIYR